jgi:phenylalanyl-tRNA synthetase alpha chain
LLKGAEAAKHGGIEVFIMRENLAQLKTEAHNELTKADSLQILDAIRVQFLGKTGAVTGLLKQVGALPVEERKDFGAAVNVLRDELTGLIADKQKNLEEKELNDKLAREVVDITLPVTTQLMGSIHPITQTTDEIIAIFAGMGFNLVTGPEIEDDFHNFTALNFPPDHPARTMHDTFFLHPETEGEVAKLLRTHTSTVQVRVMESQKPPLKLIVPGRVYRSDWDATHTPMFHQIEGLIIDKIGSFHMGHLKGCLNDFVRAIFNIDELPTRFRPSFFPFTEPSAEMDIGYARKDGKIVLGENEKWMEILGCGMVHPDVLKNCGIDPNEYQGFAFGMGVERVAMLKYGIPDLRDMYEGDLRWLSHYGFSMLEQPNRALGV